MSIYKSAIDNPVTTILVYVAVVIIGVFAFLQLPVDRFPQMDPPYITVMTTYPGASASEVEANVTKLVENSLNSVDNLKRLTSTSKDNYSTVLLEMEWGSEMDEAMSETWECRVRSNGRASVVTVPAETMRRLGLEIGDAVRVTVARI